MNAGRWISVLGQVIALWVVVFQASAPADAHDFWIEPSTFRPVAGTTVGTRLCVGEGFQGQPVRPDPEKIEQFVARTAAGQSAIDRVSARGAARLLTIDEAGPLILAYRSKPSQIELPAEKFEAYLREEGLETIIEQRRQRQESEKPGRERYSRCAKSLMLASVGQTSARPAENQDSEKTDVAKSVNGAAAGGFDRLLDLPLELVPLKNPFLLKPGEELPVRLVFQGRPLESGLIVAISREKPAEPVSARTDREGRVSVKLSGPGVWLIKCVHMFPAPPESGCDWESLWASLTFEVSPMSKIDETLNGGVDAMNGAAGQPEVAAAPEDLRPKESPGNGG